MAAGRDAWRDARRVLQSLLAEPSCPSALSTLRDDEGLKAKALLPASAVEMQLPCTIGDYTDFYSSKDHASNVGVMFRGAANALQPNWLWLPVGYHGRSSSVIVSGTDFKRPCGQLQADNVDPAKGAVYGVCKQLDFELEMVRGCLIRCNRCDSLTLLSLPPSLHTRVSPAFARLRSSLRRAPSSVPARSLASRSAWRTLSRTCSACAC